MNGHRAIRAARGIVFTLAVLALGTAVTRADQSVTIADNFPGAAFETTMPEAAGWSAEKLAEAKAWSQQLAPTAAVMIVQHGRIVAE